MCSKWWRHEKKLESKTFTRHSYGSLFQRFGTKAASDNLEAATWKRQLGSDNSEATTRERQLGSDNLEATTRERQLGKQYSGGRRLIESSRLYKQSKTNVLEIRTVSPNPLPHCITRSPPGIDNDNVEATTRRQRVTPIGFRSLVFFLLHSILKRSLIVGLFVVVYFWKIFHFYFRLAASCKRRPADGDLTCFNNRLSLV